MKQRIRACKLGGCVRAYEGPQVDETHGKRAAPAASQMLMSARACALPALGRAGSEPALVPRAPQQSGRARRLRRDAAHTRQGQGVGG
eukprot:4541788-Pleurochrysis_carterae.AAC.1